VTEEGLLPTGGQGGDTCRVTRLDERGPGTLFDCIDSQKGPRTIVFDVAGDLSLPETTYVSSHTTIDGTTAGPPGITIRVAPGRRGALALAGPITNVVIRGLRFEGNYGKAGAREFDHVALDGEGGVVSNVLVERCTLVGATDGALDITGGARDIIVRWNLFYGNPRTMLVKYGTQERIALHRNVFAENGERNPQIRGDVRTVDFVNNVVSGWKLTRDGYGTSIRNDPGASVDGNLVGNAFVAARPSDGPGLEILNYEGARPGRLWVADNVCHPRCAVESTVGAPLPAPLAVSAWPVPELRDRLLPGVGAPHRTDRDVEVVERVRSGLEAVR
jgi:pectate lyase